MSEPQIDWEALAAAAIEVRKRAYAPYSKFFVGAALAAGGRTFVGANVENASFGLTICAERAAVTAAVAAGMTRLEGIVVCTDAAPAPPSSPCGACRQVLRELAADPTTFRVLAVSPDGQRREWRLSELLPDSFSGAELP